MGLREQSSEAGGGKTQHEQQQRASMSRYLANSAIKRPVILAASSSVARGSRRGVSTKGGVGEHASAVKMPRLTHRMRRLARAHPEAVAAVSPSAVQESRSKLAPEVRCFLDISRCATRGELLSGGCQSQLSTLPVPHCCCKRRLGL